MMDRQGHGMEKADIVRTKMKALKQQIQAAEKRTQTAKDALVTVEARTRQALKTRHRIEQQIGSREVMLERLEVLVTSVKAKTSVLEHFIEDKRRSNQIPVVESENTARELKLKIVEFTKQTKNTTAKCNAFVDRIRCAERCLSDARARISSSEKTIRCLENALQSTQQRLVGLEKRRAKREELRETVVHLEKKLSLALANADELEDKEGTLEFSIMELEDKIEVYRRKYQRISSILADKTTGRSATSWNITMLLKKASETRTNGACFRKNSKD